MLLSAQPGTFLGRGTAGEVRYRRAGHQDRVYHGEERARLRAEQRDVVTGIISRYNPDAVVCVGVPFGHTRPQWILPHGGTITVDGTARRVTADYS